MTIIIFFITGLIIGSFLNVVVYRLKIAESFFWSRSHCPHCKNNIRWYDNIPVISFTLLRAKCRDCQKKISWQYPLVEIGTAVVFALIGAKFFVFEDLFSWLVAFYYLFIASSLVAILVYDWLYMEIPMIILWVAIAISAAFNLFSDYYNYVSLSGTAGSVWNLATHSGILAAVAAFLFFFLLSVKSNEKWMGMGDAYLAILLGLFLGWPKIFLALFLAFFIGSVYGIILIVLKKKNLKSQVPFAPFMVAGTFISLLFYAPIINWYFSLFH